MRAAAPALALLAAVALERTSPLSPSGQSPCRSPNPPAGLEYWIPPEATTSGNPSPFMSRKSTSPLLCPSMVVLPPTVTTGGCTSPVSEICDELDWRGTANPPLKSLTCGSVCAPSRLLPAPVAETQTSPNPNRCSFVDGANGITFGTFTVGLALKASFSFCGSTSSGRSSLSSSLKTSRDWSMAVLARSPLPL